MNPGVCVPVPPNFAGTQSNLKQIKMSGNPQTFRAYHILRFNKSMNNSIFLSRCFRELPPLKFEPEYAEAEKNYKLLACDPVPKIFYH